ncbi:larval cuticle protein LCP-14-like [Pollicipes pollicipes]|uniref:larval cuticle protein LCP-14-like n=1 Tax=Pollicipes pollicipes TaxID=41117 RepID=UPI0018856B48|nr:larval cuticle protein LCP-14-like [Pollicipes pollicipes]XP_037080230.1 larval cuticle protein LCP-14-like [Pollicipes pollicipes]
MKAVIVLCLMALAVARGDKNAEILRNDFELNAEDGSYQSDMESSNGIRMRASGISYPGNEPETGSYFVEGEYQYTDLEGNTVLVKYTADENGYKPESDILP